MRESERVQLDRQIAREDIQRAKVRRNPVKTLGIYNKHGFLLL